jgi:hypothetical protein
MTMGHSFDDIVDEIDVALDDAQWYFYQDTDITPPCWSSQLATTNQEKLKLNVIIQDSLITTFTPGGPPISALKVLQQYENLLAWRENLPDIIGRSNSGAPGLPHMVSLL